MRLELLIDVVGMVVGIVVGYLAELNSQGVEFTGEMLPKFL